MDFLLFWMPNFLKYFKMKICKHFVRLRNLLKNMERLTSIYFLSCVPKFSLTRH
uniref:Uncharacterized protein n=1 Tax=Rhizophora mucronata TaxID=61149 RepID=A0A2P2P486_RHIMU